MADDTLSLLACKIGDYFSPFVQSHELLSGLAAFLSVFDFEMGSLSDSPSDSWILELITPSSLDILKSCTVISDYN